MSVHKPRWRVEAFLLLKNIVGWDVRGMGRKATEDTVEGQLDYTSRGVDVEAADVPAGMERGNHTTIIMSSTIFLQGHLYCRHEHMYMWLWHVEL